MPAILCAMRKSCARCEDWPGLEVPDSFDAQVPLTHALHNQGLNDVMQAIARRRGSSTANVGAAL
jgi:hypothetical protein